MPTPKTYTDKRQLELFVEQPTGPLAELERRMAEAARARLDDNMSRLSVASSGGVDEVEYVAPDYTRWRLSAMEDFVTRNLWVRLQHRTDIGRDTVTAVLSRDFLLTTCRQWDNVPLEVGFFRSVFDQVAASGWDMGYLAYANTFLRFVEMAFMGEYTPEEGHPFRQSSIGCYQSRQIVYNTPVGVV